MGMAMGIDTVMVREKQQDGKVLVLLPFPVPMLALLMGEEVEEEESGEEVKEVEEEESGEEVEEEESGEEVEEVEELEDTTMMILALIRFGQEKDNFSGSQLILKKVQKVKNLFQIQQKMLLILALVVEDQVAKQVVLAVEDDCLNNSYMNFSFK